MNSQLKLLPVVFALFAEYATAHLEHRFEPFPTSLSVLTKPLHARLFHFVLDFLPPTTKCSDFRLLSEVCCIRFRR